MHTYIFDAEIDVKLYIIQELLKKRGNWKQTDLKSKNVDFVCVDGITSKKKQYYDLNIGIKNIINVEEVRNIINKDNFKISLQKLNDPKVNKILLKDKTIHLKDIAKNHDKLNSYKNFFTNNKIAALKLVGAANGKHIYICTSFETFKDICLNIINDNKEKWYDPKYIKMPKFVYNMKTKDKWVLQNYILNPLLYKKKKFHLRVIFLCLNKQNRVKKGYYFKLIPILTAKNEFIEGSYDNKSIHDSHYGSTDEEKYFPDDFEEYFGKEKTKFVSNEIFNIMKSLVHILRNVKCYEDTKNCYQTYGCDIMITDDWKVYLIEINQFHGGILSDNVYYDFYNEMLTLTVDTVFPPKNKLKTKKLFVPIPNYKKGTHKTNKTSKTNKTNKTNKTSKTKKY